jgi:hypothetical protein
VPESGIILFRKMGKTAPKIRWYYSQANRIFKIVSPSRDHLRYFYPGNVVPEGSLCRLPLASYPLTRETGMGKKIRQGL